MPQLCTIAHQHFAIYYVEVFFQDLRKSATHVTSILDHFILFVVLQIWYTMNTGQRVQIVTALALEEDGVIN